MLREFNVDAPSGELVVISTASCCPTSTSASCRDQRRAKRQTRVVKAWRWIVGAATLALVSLLVCAWLGQEPRDNVGAVEALVGIIALAGAAIPVRQWYIDNHRKPKVRLWLEASPEADAPGDEIHSTTIEECIRTRAPDYVMTRRSFILRACIHNQDPYPLRDCVVNIVVPAFCKIEALPEDSDQHRLAPYVSHQPRINLDGEDASRFTAWAGDVNAETHQGVLARITAPTGRTAPYIAMVELSGTPMPRENARFQFALIAPLGWTEASQRAEQ